MTLQVQPCKSTMRFGAVYYNKQGIKAGVPFVTDTVHAQSDSYDIHVTDEVDASCEGGHKTQLDALNRAAHGTPLFSPESNALADYRRYLRTIAQGNPATRDGFDIDSPTLRMIRLGPGKD